MSCFCPIAREDVDWPKVEVFHLNEYVDLPITHVASFRKYIKERFADFDAEEAYIVVNLDEKIP